MPHMKLTNDERYDKALYEIINSLTVNDCTVRESFDLLQVTLQGLSQLNPDEKILSQAQVFQPIIDI